MDKLRKILCRISQALKNSKPSRHLTDDNPNCHVLTVCRNLGYPEPNIRKAVLILNGKSAQKLANGVAASTLYRALNGENEHEVARVILADSVGVPVEVFFKQA